MFYIMCRARKLDWEQIKFKDYSAEECKKYWEHIQARIRRFRILAEMIPDARAWLNQPWTNFYKSKVSSKLSIICIFQSTFFS